MGAQPAEKDREKERSESLITLQIPTISASEQNKIGQSSTGKGHKEGERHDNSEILQEHKGISDHFTIYRVTLTPEAVKKKKEKRQQQPSSKRQMDNKQ